MTNKDSCIIKFVHCIYAFITQEKILHTRRPKLSFSRNNTVYCVKTLFAAFCCLRVELENKEYHHGGFQQHSTQRLDDGNEHMNRRRKAMMLRLKAIPAA